MLVVVAHPQRVQLGHELRSQVEGEPGTHARGKHPLAPVDNPQQHAGRRQGQHHQQEGQHQPPGVGSPLAPLEDLVDEVLLELGGDQFHRDPGQHQCRHRRRRPPVRLQNAPQATDDGPAGKAPRAGFPLGGESLLTLRAMQQIGRLDLFGPQFSLGAEVLKLPRDPVESGGQPIGVPEQIDPRPIDMRLDESRADRGDRPELAHLGHGHVLDQVRFGLLGDDRHIPLGHDQPFRAGLSAETEIGLSREHNRHPIQPLAFEKLFDTAGQFRCAHLDPYTDRRLGKLTGQADQRR